MGLFSKDFFSQIGQLGLMYNFLIGLILTGMAFVYILVFVKDSKEMQQIRDKENKENKENGVEDKEGEETNNNDKDKDKIEKKDEEAEGIKGKKMLSNEILFVFY